MRWAYAKNERAQHTRESFLRLPKASKREDKYFAKSGLRTVSDTENSMVALMQGAPRARIQEGSARYFIKNIGTPPMLLAWYMLGGHTSLMPLHAFPEG